MRILSYLFFLVIIIIGTTFAYLNANQVMFDYYIAQKSLPLSLLLAIALGIGILLGLLVTVVPHIKLKHKNRRLKKRLKCAEQELANLRNIPLQKDNVC